MPALAAPAGLKAGGSGFISGRKTHSVKKSIEGFINKRRDKVIELENRKKEITFHGLRYTFARREFYKRVNGGMNVHRALLEVSKLLGHNRPEVTKIYLGPVWRRK